MSEPTPPDAPLVLLVDDFQDALEIYEHCLTFKGYRIMTANSGADAITLALAHHPALILMDLRMSAMTGTEAMLVLRQDAAFSNVPIVAFTAHAMEAQRLEALAAGFDDVIAKPCLPDALMAAVDRLLASGRRQAP